MTTAPVFVKVDESEPATLTGEFSFPLVEEDIAEIRIWEHAAFANHFRNVLYERAVRASAAGTDLETLARYYECVYILDRAISRMDIDMVVAYHQHLLDAPEPIVLEVALTVLAPLTGGKKVCSAITKEHISICSNIASRFGVVAGDITDDGKSVLALIYSNLNRTERIMKLLDEGLTDANAIEGELVRRILSEA